ncbi:MAG: RNA polymerase sigma factor [Planctomycetota bacterium]
MERVEDRETPRKVGAWIEEVRVYLVRRLGSRVLSRDIAQEAAARLLLALQRDQAPRSPRAWMFRTARNLAVDEIRRRLPSPLGLEALGKVPDPVSFPDSEPRWQVGREEFTRSELLQALPQALSRLPNLYRRTLLAHYRDGLDCEGVAERERITLANAKVRLHRARRRLHVLLASAVSQWSPPQPCSPIGRRNHHVRIPACRRSGPAPER